MHKSKQIDQNKEYTAQELAKILGMSTTGVTVAIRRGKVKAEKYGGKWHVMGCDVFGTLIKFNKVENQAEGEAIPK